MRVLQSFPIWLACVCSIANVCEATEAPTLHWDERPGLSLALCDGDSVIWQFNYGGELTKPMFHPLALPDTQPLTVDRPADHAWHHGLWFSWVFIDGVNYWEHQPETGRPAGTTRWKDVVVSANQDYSAEITLTLEYGPGDAKPVLVEQRHLSISPPGNDGEYKIDWSFDFKAVEREVLLACVPIPPAPNGVPWGGYGGLSLRLAEKLDDRQLSSAEGEASFDDSGVCRVRSAACDYSGALDGKTAGIAIVDKRVDSRRPTDWYGIRSHMSYLNAAILSRESYPLSAERPWRLEYRVIVHPGRWDAAALDAASAAFNADHSAAATSR